MTRGLLAITRSAVMSNWGNACAIAHACSFTVPVCFHVAFYFTSELTDVPRKWLRLKFQDICQTGIFLFSLFLWTQIHEFLDNQLPSPVKTNMNCCLATFLFSFSSTDQNNLLSSDQKLALSLHTFKKVHFRSCLAKVDLVGIFVTRSTYQTLE